MKKHFLNIFICGAFLTAASSAMAYDFEAGGIYYDIAQYDDPDMPASCFVTSGPNLYNGEIAIPAYVEYEGANYVVAEISANAMKDCTELTAVHFPEDSQLAYIGKWAFYNCSALSRFDVPSSVWLIDDFAFTGCASLAEFVLPATVEALGDMAFPSLCRLEIADSELALHVVKNHMYNSQDYQLVGVGCDIDTLYLGREIDGLMGNAPAMMGKSMGEPVHVLEVGPLCKHVPDFGFVRARKLAEIIGLENADEIGLNAFYQCSSLGKFTLKDVFVRDDALNLTSTVPVELTMEGDAVEFESPQVFYPSIVNFNSESNTFFMNEPINGYKLEQVNIANLDSYLSASQIFSYSSSNQNSRSYAAAGEELETLTIPDDLYSIRNDAFNGCASLKTLNLHEDFAEIGSSAFKNCTGLRAIYSANPEPPVCSASSFAGTNIARCIVYVPIGSLDAYWEAEGWNTFFYIEEYDFSGVSSITVDSADDARYFDMMGREVVSPVPGRIYLRGGSNPAVIRYNR